MADDSQPFSFPEKIEVSLEANKKDLLRADEDDEPEKITLELNGVGLCEWGFFAVDLYRAGLYLEKPCRDPQKIIDSGDAKCIHLYFLRSLSREQLRKAYDAAFKVNAKQVLPALKERIDKLLDMMEDVEKGDSLIFVYLPELGIEVRLKNRVKGVIEGFDFASAFFRLYLGSSPPDEDLKRGLLGLNG